MIMPLLQHVVVVIVLGILSSGLCFGLQQQQLQPVNHVVVTLPSSKSSISFPKYPQRAFFGKATTSTHQSSYYNRNRFSCLMTPFWKSPSSDNEKKNNNSNNEEDKKEEEDVTKAQSDEASAIPDGNEINRAVVSSDLSATTTPSSSLSSSSLSSSSSSSSSSTSKKGREGILDLINDIGQNFKPLAEKATAKGYQADTQTKKIFYAAQACVYYLLFILYRAYRGLFVLVPAVFRQVYRKMELAMNSDLTLQDNTITTTNDDDNDNDNVLVGISDAAATTENNVSWRTKLTVSVLASVVTMSYMLGAVVKMMTKFVGTVSKSRSIPKSFEAAADELLTYEERVSRIGKINGDTKMEPGGFAP
jgi:hypothetical protein